LFGVQPTAAATQPEPEQAGRNRAGSHTERPLFLGEKEKLRRVLPKGSEQDGMEQKPLRAQLRRRERESRANGQVSLLAAGSLRQTGKPAAPRRASVEHIPRDRLPKLTELSWGLPVVDGLPRASKGFETRRFFAARSYLLLRRRTIHG